MKNFTDDEVEELIGPIVHLADQRTSTERKDGQRDAEMDLLIMAARHIKKREGFEVMEIA